MPRRGLLTLLALMQSAVASARTADFRYLQHIVVAYAHPVGDHHVPVLPADFSRGPGEGRLADPSRVVLDTQSLHAAASVPADTTGRDANKKVPGRKRGRAVDVLGLVIAVVVLAASSTTTPPAPHCWTRLSPARSQGR